MKFTLREEITLTEALSEAHIKELNDEVPSGDNTWVKAIVLVTKCDASRNFALAVNSGDGKPLIVKDFGSMAAIVRIDKIFPYIKLNSSNTPVLKNKRDIILFFKRNGYTEEEVADIESLLSDKTSEGEDKDKERLENDRAIVKNKIINLEVKNCLLTIDRYSEAKQLYYESKRLFKDEESDY